MATDLYEAYALVVLRIIRENVLGAYTQCELLSWTSSSIHVLLTPEFCRSLSVSTDTSPDFRSHVCKPQSLFIIATEFCHSDAERRIIEPVYPLVQSAMQYGKHPASLNVSTHATSIHSLLQAGRTHSAASTTGALAAREFGDVCRVAGQRMESSLIFERPHPM